MWYDRSIIQMEAKAVLPLLLFFLSFPLLSQTTFNRRYSGMGQLVFESAHPLSSGYLAVGVGYDTVGIEHIDMYTFVLDETGEVLTVRNIGEADAQLFATGNAISEQSEFFVQTGISYRNDTTRFEVCWINSNGDTTLCHLYDSPNTGLADPSWSNYVLPYFSYLMEDGVVYFAGLIGTSETANDAILYKLDPQGHELWHYVHATLSDPDVIRVSAMPMSPSLTFIPKQNVISILSRFVSQRLKLR